MPAKTGIEWVERLLWIAACAGMTIVPAQGKNRSILGTCQKQLQSQITRAVRCLPENF